MAINLFQSSNNNNIFGNTTPWAQPTWNSKTTPVANTVKVEGSYRAPFQQVKLDYIPQDSSQYGPQYSTTIILQPEYKGLSLMMVRLEDYYLIRSKQIQRFHQQPVEQACRMGQFNDKLISQANPQTLLPPQFPTLRNAWNASPNTNPLFNSTSTANTTNIFNSNTNPIFPPQTQAPASNIFNSKPVTNIFQQPMNQQQNNTAPNLFAQPTNNAFNNSQPNIFANNQQLKPTQNIFAQPNQQNQPNQPNMFSQPQNGFNLFNQQPIFPQNMVQQPYNYQYYPQPQMMYPPQYMMYPIPIPTVEQMKESVNQIQNYAELMNSKLQQYMQIKEQEQQRYEQQELVIQEHERQTQQYRQQRERMLNQPLSISRATKSRSPSPFSQPKNKSSHTNQSLRRSQLNETSNPISQFDYSQSSVMIEIVVKFMESEKQLIQHQEFKPKCQVQDVKQFLEIQLAQQNIFGKNRYQYFQLCRITTEGDLILDETIGLDRCPNKIIFQYFSTIIPKLTKQGYKCNADLNQMSEQELMNVNNFTVITQFGSVKWTTPCNILYLDLDKIVDMQQECINLYDEQQIHDLLKPNIGVKLNKECEITFKLPTEYKILDAKQFESNLRMQAQDQNINFISFDLETKSYTFKVQHFSGYHFNSDFCSTDDSTYQVPVNQIAVQTNNQETMLMEQQESSSSEDLENEDFLEKKRIFNKLNQIASNPSNKNFIINQMNVKYNLQNQRRIPYNKQPQFIKIKNLDLLQLFCNENIEFSDLPLKMSITAKLVSALWSSKDNTNFFKYKLFNVLFGNSFIKISHFAKQIKKGMISLDDLKLIESNKQQRGLILSLLFENQRRQQNMDYKEALIAQNRLTSIQKVLALSNQKQQIKVVQKDFIDYFLDWRLNNQQPKPLYKSEWWKSLYNQFKIIPVNSPEEAAMIYFLLKKTKQPYSEYNLLFKYIIKGNDVFTFFLFSIIIKKQKVLNDSMKLIGRALITNLMKNSVEYSILQNILYSYKNCLYNKSEISKIEALICSSQFYSQNASGNQKIDQLIDKKDFEKAAGLILQLRKTQEYQEILIEYILPFLIINNEQYTSTYDSSKILIQQIINSIQQQSPIIVVAQVYNGYVEYDSEFLNQVQIKNEYQYHMKQKMQTLFDDEF